MSLSGPPPDQLRYILDHFGTTDFKYLVTLTDVSVAGYWPDYSNRTAYAVTLPSWYVLMSARHISVATRYAGRDNKGQLPPPHNRP